MTPQIIYLVLICISLMIHISQHGKVSSKPHDATASFAAMILVLAILTWGGFFDCFLKR